MSDKEKFITRVFWILLLFCAVFCVAFIFKYKSSQTESVIAALIIMTVCCAAYGWSVKNFKVERERTGEAEKKVKELENRIAEQDEAAQTLQQSKDKYHYAAFHDLLTNLPNRNLFIETLKYLLEKSRQTTKYEFAVLYLDLNRFKTINESLGHSTGDKLILHVGKRLSNFIREGDLVARFGGDKFALILNNLPNAETAVELAEGIQKMISEPFIVGGRRVFTGVSIGIAIGNSNYTEAEEIVRDADIAMYYAKDHEKNYEIFDSHMHTRAVALLQLETDLRYAIERSELVAYYQPIIDLRSMKLSGFEALIRWNHPQRGLVSPGEFIPVSEATGEIIPITLWMLRHCCTQFVEWQRKSPLNEKLILSVNLSGKHFAEENLVQQIGQILFDTSLNPECLKLEITESAVMENPEEVIAMLVQLKSLGIKLSIDDFGTGYSSLSYLHSFPMDTLKVDRSFVSTMDERSEHGEIVRTITSLAKTLGMNVIAEGIETIHQLHQLRILGCEFGQGYLFSRPVPFAEAEKLLDTRDSWQSILPSQNTIPASGQESSTIRVS